MEEAEIQSVFESQPDGTVFLMKVTPGAYTALTVSLFEAASDRDMPIIYVGVKRPYVHLKKVLEDHGLPEEDIYVVDTITKTITDEGVVDVANARFLDSPRNLTNISTAISLMAETITAENALLVIDSLEALLDYNTDTNVSRFLEDLNSRTQTLELDLILFKQEQSVDEQIGETLYPIVDELLLPGENQTNAPTVTDLADDKAVVTIPIDIARVLDWSEGEELSFTVTDDNKLVLSKT